MGNGSVYFWSSWYHVDDIMNQIVINYHLGELLSIKLGVVSYLEMIQDVS